MLWTMDSSGWSINNEKSTLGSKLRVWEKCGSVIVIFHGKKRKVTSK